MFCFVCSYNANKCIYVSIDQLTNDKQYIRDNKNQPAERTVGRARIQARLDAVVIDEDADCAFFVVTYDDVVPLICVDDDDDDDAACESVDHIRCSMRFSSLITLSLVTVDEPAGADVSDDDERGAIGRCSPRRRLVCVVG